MTEALATAPEINSGVKPLLPLPPLPEMPFHLKRSTIQQIRRESGNVPEKLWNQRGELVEQRVMSILETQIHVVETVEKHPPYTRQSDLTLIFKEGFPLDKASVEVKSSSQGIAEYKQRIRDGLPEGEKDADHVRLWMTENRIILLNGGESHGKEKTAEEILEDSFYPQLNRIIANEISKRAAIDPIQVFPEA